MNFTKEERKEYNSNKQKALKSKNFRLVTIWMAEDMGDVDQSGFGKTKADAIFAVVNNRGYHDAQVCRYDGWLGDCRKIQVPAAAAKALIKSCEL